MATRTTLRPTIVINKASMAVDITSAPTILQSLSKVGYTYVWAGTAPIGAISIEASNDYALNPDGSVANAGTWNTLEISVAGSPVTSAPVTGNSGNGAIDIDEIAFYAVRTKYKATSGTGLLTAVVNGRVA